MMYHDVAMTYMTSYVIENEYFIITTLAVHNNTRPYHVLDHLSVIFIILILILVTQHLIERVAA